MVVIDPGGSHRHTAKGRATRERILSTATQLLLSEGISGFTLSKVRHAGSVSGSQLSHYFPDKQALIQDVVTRQIGVVLAFHLQPELGSLTSFDEWERWAELNVGRLREIGYRGTPTYHVLAGQMAKLDQATRSTIADGYRQWADLLEDSFTRMKDSGLIDDSAAPRELALTVIAAHQGAGMLAFAHRQEWPVVDACRFLVNHLRNAASSPVSRTSIPPPPTIRLWTRESAADDVAPCYTAKGLATRARIVRGAADLMFIRGVHRTSLDDVRRHVGASGSQLTRYFHGKRDLTRHVVALRADDVLRFHSRPNLARLDSLSALQNWANAYLGHADVLRLHGGCIFGSLVGEVLEADDGLLDQVAIGYQRWLAVLYDGLSAMGTRGELRPGVDPGHLAAVLLTAHQGGAMLMHVTGTTEPLELVLNAAVSYVASFTLRSM